MDASWIILGGFCVFVGAVFVYVVLMIFFPEWVGITGKTALEAERGHAEERSKPESPESDS